MHWNMYSTHPQEEEYGIALYTHTFINLQGILW